MMRDATRAAFLVVLLSSAGAAAHADDQLMLQLPATQRTACGPCSDFECPANYKQKSDFPADFKCKEDKCTKDDCCVAEVVPSSCSGFECPEFYKGKSGKATTKCSAADCTVKECCDPSTCSGFVCPAGYEDKPGITMCSAADCTKDECCTPPGGPPAYCLAFGDPHFKTFDNVEFTLMGARDNWLIKSAEVSLQSRSRNHQGWMHGVAAGGTFLEDNTFSLELDSPDDGEGVHFRWNFKDIDDMSIGPLPPAGRTWQMLAKDGKTPLIKATLTRTLSLPEAAEKEYYAKSTKVDERYNNQAKADYTGEGKLRGVTWKVELPRGITLFIARVDYITLVVQNTGGKLPDQDGMCGRQTGIKANDALAELKKLPGYKPPLVGKNLFMKTQTDNYQKTCDDGMIKVAPAVQSEDYTTENECGDFCASFANIVAFDYQTSAQNKIAEDKACRCFGGKGFNTYDISKIQKTASGKKNKEKRKYCVIQRNHEAESLLKPADANANDDSAEVNDIDEENLAAQVKKILETCPAADVAACNKIGELELKGCLNEDQRTKFIGFCLQDNCNNDDTLANFDAMEAAEDLAAETENCP